MITTGTPGSSDAANDHREWILPAIGGNPGNEPTATTPGSFANKPNIGGPMSYSSPDTPGMPAPSSKTAWDFLPQGWATDIVEAGTIGEVANGNTKTITFKQNDGSLRSTTCPADFKPITQLESARLGIITTQMQRVAEREGHLTPLQVRDEIGAGRMVIPANVKHLEYKLDPMAIGRASKTKINANMGASPVSSGMDEEIEKLQWAERWGADTVMDLSTGGDLDACRQALIENSTTPIGTVPIYSMIIGKKSKTSTKPSSSKPSNIKPIKVSITSPSMQACFRHICPSHKSDSSAWSHVAVLCLPSG